MIKVETISDWISSKHLRRNGHDLFDLSMILTHVPKLDKEKVIQSYERYLAFISSHLPTYKEFVMNIEK